MDRSVNCWQNSKRKGVVRFTGLGGTTAHQLPAIMATGVYDVVLAAQNYSLLWREAAISIFPEAKRQNMGIVIGAPLQQGALSRRHAEVETGAWWLSRPRQEQFKVHSISFWMKSNSRFQRRVSVWLYPILIFLRCWWVPEICRGSRTECSCG